MLDLTFNQLIPAKERRL